MKKLQGKTAIITGGNSGMGLPTAQEFIALGKVHLQRGAIFFPEAYLKKWRSGFSFRLILLLRYNSQLLGGGAF